MGRVLSTILIVLAALLLSGALLWYLAYGIDEAPPQRVTVEELDSPVQIGWHDNGLVSIADGSEADQLAALGYVHGRRRTWNVVLWRQTALGELGVWFGDRALAIDSLSRRLGFASMAKQAFNQLPEQEQALLQAYTTGMNAALQHSAAQMDPNLTLLQLSPSPWQPWHSLAIERLFAWLTTTPPSADSLQQTSRQARTLFAADQELRNWLHVGGLHHSAAWVAQDSLGSHLYRRYVHGSSALPFMQEVALHQADSSYVLGASLPGTPFFPAGQTPQHAWVVLPKSPIQLSQEAAAPDTTRQHERLIGTDGKEYLMRIARQPGRLPLYPPQERAAQPSAADTTQPALPADTAAAPAAVDTMQGPQGWVLRWQGLQPVSDATAWFALTRGTTAPFSLLDGDGLLMRQSGQWSILGSPEVTASLSGGVVVGNTPWLEQVAHRLDSLSMRPSPNVASWDDDCYSTWAADLTPSLVATVDTVRREAPDALQEAITYLRNWDYRYTRSSIAASVFDTWANLYQDSTGVLPGGTFADSLSLFPHAGPYPAAPAPRTTPATPDTTDTTAAPSRPDTLAASYRRHVERYLLLKKAVRQLRQKYGSDLSKWRWERTNPARYFFPVWSDDSLASGSSLMARTRYAPLELPGMGHPTAPCWGSSPILADAPVPAAWQGWTTTNSWNQLTVRRRRFELTNFLERYRISDRPPAPIVMEPFSPPERTTRLVPPS